MRNKHSPAFILSTDVGRMWDHLAVSLVQQDPGFILMLCILCVAFATLQSCTSWLFLVASRNLSIQTPMQDMDSRLADDVIYQNVRAVRPRNNANYVFAVPRLAKWVLHVLNFAHASLALGSGIFVALLCGSVMKTHVCVLLESFLSSSLLRAELSNVTRPAAWVTWLSEPPSIEVPRACMLSSAGVICTVARWFVLQTVLSSVSATRSHGGGGG